MNKKLIIGGIVALVIILALPLLLNFLGQTAPAPEPQAPRAAPAPSRALPAEEETPPTPPEPIVWEGTHEPPPPVTPQYQQRDAGGQAELNAETLVGTAWEVPTPHGTVQIELGPNGQATASHPLVGSIPGNWQIRGNRVTASATFMGESVSIDATIQGNRLSVPGQNIRRVR